VSEEYQGKHRSGVDGDALDPASIAFIASQLESASSALGGAEPQATRRRSGLGAMRYAVRDDVRHALATMPNLKNPPHGELFGASRILAMAMAATPRGRRRRMSTSEAFECSAVSAAARGERLQGRYAADVFGVSETTTPVSSGRFGAQSS
jgi:hypothetical protein